MLCPAGQHAHLCPAGDFHCGNGHCVSAALRCDGSNDCGDDSDEAGCLKPPCVFGACPHTCQEYKKTYKCVCGSGYAYNRFNNTCVAQGTSLHLVFFEQFIKWFTRHAVKEIHDLQGNKFLYTNHVDDEHLNLFLLIY